MQALAALRGGRWEYVLLHEKLHATVLEREQFFESVRRFDQAVRLRGGKTVLLMTWERPDAVGKGITTANVAEAYHAIGAELGAVVAPVGLVFAQSLQARPDIVLNEADGHPTAAGSYLAACVIMGKVLGKVPWGIPYASRAMRREMRAYLREAAASGLAGALRG